ncbi:Lhr family helicase [Edaphobacter flagellatus]|uniref:Lhr family helicase n=1 Tax=Edaphobacter flagellatus TaxID=1933044 RepID=UPI0021B165C8|nr:DEAD/DEAH box helicase [Edaphobacter flagellatus]
MQRTPPKSKKVNSSPSSEKSTTSAAHDALALFHPITAKWFRAAFHQPTRTQIEGWPAIARGDSTLILAPTGTGKTLTAFLWCLDKLMLQPAPDTKPGCRILYISPLKALAVDVERNLRAPLAEITSTAAQEGVSVRTPDISVRTGDTPQRERAKFRRNPGEILITTPESLYLLLTSEASEGLRSVETVIIDEIHALVPTKRGAHLALSLERLEALTERPVQRIGLSATQRPLEEVARFLGGANAASEKFKKHLEKVPQSAETEAEAATMLFEAAGDRQDSLLARSIPYRAVTVVNAGAKKLLELKVEVPVEDMARLSRTSGKPGEPKQTSIWQSIYPRLLEIIRERTSTLIFVNARRTAERLAGSINDLAGEAIARAHHGSLAAAQRSEIEEMLKAGQIKALVATSSLELGIDMGAIDLVIQIESPPSVASGMQRIGRAGHTVGVPSSGIIFPKYRADLVACAAVTRAMHEGHVESTRYLRNPLDVLAQQIVATVSHPPIDALEAEKRRGRGERDSPGISYDALFRLIRGAAPFALLSQIVFDGVLDMLAGRYPSDEFAELRPRITWDRKANWITPRSGVKSIAILNGGTIPDRGLYGVFLAGERAKPIRVGELDEEMVFESRAGEVFTLGASSWRIEEITHDRVLVTPASGEAGKMPFWRGDKPGRPLEFGRIIGALVRELGETPHNAALAKLTSEHDLELGAAENLLQYLRDQKSAVGMVPDDRGIVIERVRDERGDWRVCVLTPFGTRIHAPWAMAAAAKLRSNRGVEVETMWGDDGFVIRFPDTDQPPDTTQLLLAPEEAVDLVLNELGATAMFASKFRESAARALLLPRHRANRRSPLWQQRKRAHDLLAVASRFASFPILLEAYRECMRDVFDIPALTEILRLIATQSLQVHTVDTQIPSPFAAALLFSYVANYIYDGDAPLAERRAQALAIDESQLRELMGDADLRELLNTNAIEQVEEQLQGLAEGYCSRTIDGIHDLLLRVGDLCLAELQHRTAEVDLEKAIQRLLKADRIIEITIAGEQRFIAIEDAARYRDAVGISLSPKLPATFLAKIANPTTELLRRYARTHGPFTLHEIAARFGLPAETAEPVLNELVQSGRIAEGGFRPGGMHREWCDNEVLRLIRRKSLARLRKEVEPAEQATLARLFTRWQGVVQPRRGLDALLDVLEILQGAPLPASIVETEILPARILGYKPSDLDTLIAAGEVTWIGLESLGERDGRIAFYLAENLPQLRSPQIYASEALSEREAAIVDYVRERGASFFQQIHEGAGGGYPGETLNALWSLVWKGMLTNDGMAALRAYCERPESSRKRRDHQQTGFRSRRTTPPAGQGRWTLQPAAYAEAQNAAQATVWRHAIAQQLLARYGVVFREAAQAENLSGGFSAIYDVLKAMEESGKVRRGYFAADIGATQFALPSAVDLLRSLRNSEGRIEIVQLAATDPANPYGALLRWPQFDDTHTTLTRSVGAQVILWNGALAVYMRRANPNIQVFLPEDEPQRSSVANALAAFLVRSAQDRSEEKEAYGLLIATINGVPAQKHWMADILLHAGFSIGARGFHVRRVQAKVQVQA